MLLLTFSRRAAAEMTRRVERIARKVMGDTATAVSDALTWSGTFHGIGARLLREFAAQIGLDPAFTIHDREDSADLMNIVRHELGMSAAKSRFPAKGTCLAIYSRVVNAEADLDEVLKTTFPWCAMWGAELRDAVRGLCRREAAPERPRLRRPAALLGRDDERRLRSPRRSASASTTSSSTSTRTPTACSPRSSSRSSPTARG